MALLFALCCGCGSRVRSTPAEQPEPPAQATEQHHPAAHGEGEMCLEPPPEVVEPEPCDEPDAGQD